MLIDDRTRQPTIISPNVEDPPRRPAAEKSSPGRSISNTIVVVDDEEEICAAIKEVLEERGYSVEVAGNGVHAMAIVNLMAAHPRLVILDLSMPWMGGKEMLAALKSNPVLADIPVIVSTADPSPTLNGIPVVKKPIDVDLLLETIRANC
jgi:CheY-like chemotaxis protein